MLAGAADAAIVPSGVGGFMACKALSKRNSDPSGASRPWDTERDGFVMGEGGGESGRMQKRNGFKVWGFRQHRLRAQFCFGEKCVH